MGTIRSILRGVLIMFFHFSLIFCHSQVSPLFLSTIYIDWFERLTVNKEKGKRETNEARSEPQEKEQPGTGECPDETPMSKHASQQIVLLSLLRCHPACCVWDENISSGFYSVRGFCTWLRTEGNIWQRRFRSDNDISTDHRGMWRISFRSPVVVW